MRATTAGVLDRALDVAAALEVRGYGAARPLRSRAFVAAVVSARPRVPVLGRGRGRARDRRSRRRPGGVPRLPDPGEPGGCGGAGDAAPCCSFARWRRSPIGGGSGDGARRRAAGPLLPLPGRCERRAHRFDLTIAPGELVVLAGESGSGKSTLLRALSGLVPHFHGGRSPGSARVTGLDTREHGPGELARGVGTLFQDPETQVVMGTVRAELAFALENRGEPQAAIARAVEEVALALAIDPLLSTIDRGAVRRRAATGRAGSDARRAPCAGAARRTDVAARPGGWGRADRAAPPAQRGHRPDNRCSPSTG